MPIFNAHPVGTEPHVLLFTGHMIDRDDRKAPRFPKDKEALAREAIHQAVAEEKKRWEAGKSASFLAIASGACGGDILFHEVCAELGIPGQVYLPHPREDHLRSSVRFAGDPWVDRFDRLWQSLEQRVLSESPELPDWLLDEKSYSIWARTNLWMLHDAFAYGATHVTLIALWNGEKGDGPGGTEHLVAEAEKRGARRIVLDSDEIFGLEKKAGGVRIATGSEVLDPG